MKRRWIQLFGVGIAGIIAAAWLVSCETSTPPTNSSTTTTSESSSTPPAVADSVVVLAVNVGPKPRSQRLSTAAEMSVSWSNTDDRGHTIRFEGMTKSGVGSTPRRR